MRRLTLLLLCFALPARAGEIYAAMQAEFIPVHKTLGSCDAFGKCQPGYGETCRLHGAEKAKRTDRMKREFKRRMPCPTTGKIQPSCPGWEIDHLIPLCCGGKDEWTNARWLEHDLHKLRHRDGVDCTGFPPLAYAEEDARRPEAPAAEAAASAEAVEGHDPGGEEGVVRLLQGEGAKTR